MTKKVFLQNKYPSYLLSHSTESRNKISIGMKETLSKLSIEEMRKRMLNSCCAESVYTPERAEKISKSHTGKKLSAITKIKLSKKCIFISPEGEEFRYDGLNIGCEINKFNYGSVKNNLLNNKPYKGWTILYG